VNKLNTDQFLHSNLLIVVTNVKCLACDEPVDAATRIYRVCMPFWLRMEKTLAKYIIKEHGEKVSTG
jgi:hypothetical protein